MLAQAEARKLGQYEVGPARTKHAGGRASNRDARDCEQDELCVKDLWSQPKFKPIPLPGEKF